jgi:hypothetical protein
MAMRHLFCSRALFMAAVQLGEDGGNAIINTKAEKASSVGGRIKLNPPAPGDSQR